MNESEQFVKEFLENVLTFFSLNTEVDVSIDGEVIQASVPSTTMNGFLIGERGNNLRALQYITANALAAQGLEFHRVNVDVADYKKQRAERLAEEAQEWIKEVQTSGEPKHLTSMNPADRRTVHQAVAEADGVISESAGEGRERHVVIKPE